MDHSRADATSAPSSSQPRLSAFHIRALDGLRGLAILLVLVYHQTILWPSTAAEALLARIGRFGWCGVDLFFVLSGFLITGLLLDAKGAPRYFRNFYVRRVLRIFPLYYAFLLVELVLVPLVARRPAPGEAGSWYWSYLSNVPIARHGFHQDGLDVTWSLAIEEQFYLVWPCVVLWLSRRTLARFCGAVIAVVFLARSALVIAGYSPFPLYVLTPFRLDALAMGGWIAASVRAPIKPKLLESSARFGALAGILVLILWAVPGNEEWLGSTMQEAGYTALALFFGALLVICLRGGRIATLFEARPLRVLGKYSYAIYLFHFPIVLLLRRGLGERGSLPRALGSQIPAQLLFYAVASIVALLLAAASWHLYERRFLRLKDRFAPPLAATGADTHLGHLARELP